MSFFNHLKFDPEPEGEQPISDEQDTRLLSVGVRGPRRPVDALIECLEREAGHPWFERVLDVLVRQAVDRSADAMLDGLMTLEELRRAKSAAKVGMRGAVGPEEAAGATALYFCAIASALAHHGERITARTDDDLLPVLADLADAVPARWRDMFQQSLAR